MNATATAPARQRKPRPKAPRSIKLIMAPTATMAGLLKITVGKGETYYLLTVAPADYGKGFLLEKVDPADMASYHVNIDGDKRACDCKGFLKWGHCKHADGLAALVADGRM
jgi:hypothetical protein